MDFIQFYNNPDSSDVTIITQNSKIYAHQIILKAASPVLAAMLKSGILESQRHEINLTAFLAKNVETVIYSMYFDAKNEFSNRIKISFNDISELEDLCNLVEYCNYDSFKTIISKVLSKNYSEPPQYYDNDQIVRLIFKYDLPDLYRFVAELCMKHEELIKNIDYDDYCDFRTVFDIQYKGSKIKYDLLWCEYHDDPKAIKQFICDIDWANVNKETLNSIVASPILTKYPYINSFIKFLISDSRQPSYHMPRINLN